MFPMWNKAVGQLQSSKTFTSEIHRMVSTRLVIFLAAFQQTFGQGDCPVLEMSYPLNLSTCPEAGS